MIEKNSRLGPIATVAVNVAVWLFATVLVLFGHQLFFRFGWLHSTSSLSGNDIAVAFLTGTIVGLWEWSDREKKRDMEERKQQVLDATMI